MTLEAMHRVVATREPQGTSPIADLLLAPWNVSPKCATFFRASANFVFTFTQNGSTYFLRFTGQDERTLSALRSELEFVGYLWRRGVPVARPRPSSWGREIERVETPLGSYYAVVFEGLEGAQFETGSLSLEHFSRWGRALGELHRAAADFGTVARPTWRTQLRQVAETLTDDEQAAKHALALVGERLGELQTTPETFGLVHFDFELDNLLWEQDRISIMDFDDCAYTWFIADVAFALRDLFGDAPQAVNLSDVKLQAFVEGYRNVKTLDDRELELVPVFLAFHNLVVFAKLHRTLGTPQPDEPAWLAALRVELAVTMARYRENFSHVPEMLSEKFEL